MIEQVIPEILSFFELSLRKEEEEEEEEEEEAEEEQQQQEELRTPLY